MSTCPNCGKPIESSATLGLCPECLLKAGLTGASSAGASRKFTPPSPQELSRFFPQLEIIELLGRGGMGAVYKARQKNLDRMVALKILPQDVGQDPAFTQRFVREAKALAKLNHPNIITLYEFGQADGYFFFLMEFIDGMNLGELLDSGRVQPREALAIVPQVCDGLQYAHDHGIVHRDIKPANIMIDRRGRVKVADFGLAKLVGGGDPASSRGGSIAAAGSSIHGGTEAGQVLGTPHYMAPEQIERPADVDHRADIYSLGVVIYELLTGELPPAKLEPPSKKYQIDVRLDDVVLRALEKQPDRRYQQASEVKTHVENIAAAPAAKKGGLGSRLVDQTWGKSAVIAAIGMFVLLFGALTFAMKKHSPIRSVTSTAVVPPAVISAPNSGAAAATPEVQQPPAIQPVTPPKPQYGDTNPPLKREPPKNQITAGAEPGARRVDRFAGQNSQIGEASPFTPQVETTNAPKPPITGAAEELARAAPKSSALQIGEVQAPQPVVTQNPEPELLRIQLRQAEKSLPLLEAQEKAGQIERAKVLDAKDNIEVLKAQIAGDGVQVARLKLATAKRQLETAEIMFKRGLIGSLEIQAARDAVELREAELRIAEIAATKNR